MLRVTVIVGLPGSGKSHLAETMAADYVLDDLSVFFTGEIKIPINHGHLIITDHRAGLAGPSSISDRIFEWFNSTDVTIIAFENDPEACWGNIQRRNDCRKISKSYLDSISKIYDLTKYQDIRPVYKPESSSGSL
jgi:hypothetical protein